MDDQIFNQFLIINQINIEKSSVTCGECNNWLTQPIHLVNDVNYCSQCIQENAVENVALEDVLNIFKYPCVNDGCEYLLDYRNIVEHSNNCSNASPYTNCTFCEGKCDKLKISEHLIAEHNTQVNTTDSFKFTIAINVPLANMNIHLIEINNVQFLFFYTQQVDVLRGTLMKVKQEHIIDIDKYTIHITTNMGTTFILEGVLQQFGTPQAIAKQIEFYIGKASSCNLEVSLGSRHQINVPECPICMYTIGSKVRQCVNGHNFCKDCGSKVDKCPICCMEVCNQLTNVQHLYPDAMWPCRNYKSGCMAYFNDSDDKPHMEVCAYRNIKCCACTLSIRQCDLLMHMKNDHTLNNNFYVVDSGLSTLNRKGSCTTYIVFDSKVFECIITSDDFNVEFTCKLAYKKDQCSHEYRVEFQIISDMNRTKAAHVINDVVCANPSISPIAWYKLSQFTSPLLVRCCIFKHNSHFALPCVTRVFFDISGDSKPLGRIVMELYNDIVPKTAGNFRALCTHQKGYGYKGSSFTDICKDNFCEGGIILKHNSEKCSDRFEPENKLVNYVESFRAGALVMENTSSNCSQFNIVTSIREPDWSYEPNYVMFGKVVTGLDVVKKMESFEAKEASRVCIVNCGEL